MSLNKTRNSWRKWYLSGAVKQPTLPQGGLVIDATCEHYNGTAAGYSTLSLARPEDRGNGRSFSPVMCVIVPTGKFVPGKLITKLPGNAAPIDLFFPETKNILETRTKEKSIIPEAPVLSKVVFRHQYSGLYTIVEKNDGWDQGEISLFVSGGAECERLEKFPGRLVISTVVDKDEIESILGHTKTFSVRYATYGQRWQ